MLGSARVTGAALDTLSDIKKWRLPAGKWDTVASLIDVMADAHAAGNVAEFQHTTRLLEQISPKRIILIGEGPTEPPPPPVRDRLNRLIHSLDDTEENPDE